MINYEKFRSYMVAKRYAKTSIEEHIRAIERFEMWMINENMILFQIAYNDLMEYVRFLQQKETAMPYINNQIQSIKHLFRFMITEKLCTNNPALHIRLQSRQKKVLINLLSKQQLDEVFNSLSQSQPLPRFKATHSRRIILLSLMIYQGLTATELQRLLVTDLNFMEGTIEVPESTNVNGRILKLEAKQIMPLQAYISSIKGEKLFQMRINDLLRDMFSYLRKLGHTVNASLIRSSVIVHWLKQYDIVTVKYFAGHKYISSTQKYQQQMIESLQAEVEKFHPLM